jgi:hypothetical protein
MAIIPSFYSVNEVKKQPRHRVYHNNAVCPPGRDIPAREQKIGTGGYRLCEDCVRLNQQGR